MCIWVQYVAVNNVENLEILKVCSAFEICWIHQLSLIYMLLEETNHQILLLKEMK